MGKMGVPLPTTLYVEDTEKVGLEAYSDMRDVEDAIASGEDRPHYVGVYKLQAVKLMQYKLVAHDVPNGPNDPTEVLPGPGVDTHQP